MKTPESGTDVFAIDTRSASNPGFTSGFPVDLQLYRNTGSSDGYITTRLTGQKYVAANSTGAEGNLVSGSNGEFDYNTGWMDSTATISNLYSWMFKRAAGFMDVVAYTGNGASGRQITHNLAANVGMLIVKKRSGSQDWWVWHSGLNANGLLRLNTNAADNGSDGVYVFGNGTTAINPTSSVFTVNAGTDAASTIYLPASPVTGWNARFICNHPSDAHTITITENGASTAFMGIADSGDAIDALTGTASVVIAASDFKLGDWFETTWDGTIWRFHGQFQTDASVSAS